MQTVVGKLCCTRDLVVNGAKVLCAAAIVPIMEFPFWAKTSVKDWGGDKGLGIADISHRKDILELSSVQRCRYI